MKFSSVRLFTVLLLLAYASTSVACEFTMGYRTSERLPLIQEAPNNTGLYEDLYKAALTKIGCSLKVIRAPKKRIMKMLIDGELDFYPGLGFSEARAKHIYFFENGLTSQSVILTRKDKAIINSLKDLKNSVLIRAHGANTTHFDNDLNIAIRYVHDLSIAQAVDAIENNKADFFIYNSYALKFYLKQFPNDKVKLHSCCGDALSMLVGFSKQSPHVKAIAGDTSRMTSFKNALAEISESGELAHLFNNYY